MKKKLHILNIVILQFFLAKVMWAGELDSLIKSIDNVIDPVEKVDLLNEISRKYSHLNLDSVIFYADEAYRKALAVNYEKGQVTALFRKCYYYIQIGDFHRTSGLVKQGESLAEKIGDKNLLATSYLIYGDIFTYTHVYDQAFTYLTYALDIYISLESKEQELFALNRIGILYTSQNDYEKALEIFEKILGQAKEINHQEMIFTTLNNIAGTYSSMGNHQKALEIYQELYKNYKEKVAEDNSYRDLYFVSVNLLNEAITLLSLGDTTNAINKLNQALAVSKQSGELKLENRILLQKSIVLFKQNNLESAEKGLIKVFETAKEFSWLELAIKSSKNLALLYQRKEEHKKALDFYISYMDYVEIIESEGNTKTLAELQFKYDFEKEALQLKEENQRKTILFIASGVFLMMFIIIVLVLFINQRTRTSKAILEQENLVLEQGRLRENFSNELEMKNKEITSVMIHIQKKNDILKTIASKLEKAKKQFNVSNRELIGACIKELKSNIDDSNWQYFEVQFNQVYESFFQKLDEINSDLTIHDRRLCAYLKIKMTTKEIASITNSSIRSIEVARYRLRKKLKINDPSVSLASFLDRL